MLTARLIIKILVEIFLNVLTHDITVSTYQIQRSAGEYLNDPHPFLADLSFILYGILQGYIMHLIVQDAYKHIITSFQQAFNCMEAHPAGDQPVDATG